MVGVSDVAAQELANRLAAVGYSQEKHKQWVEEQVVVSFRLEYAADRSHTHSKCSMVY